MADMTPWQMLLWIVALMMIAVPLIGILYTTIINSHYKAKEQFLYRFIANFSKAIGTAGESILKSMEQKEKNNGQGRKDQGIDSHPDA